MIHSSCLNNVVDPDARLEQLHQAWLNLNVEILNTLDQVNIIQHEIEENERMIAERLDRL